ncbi:MAG: transaldolase family protein [Tepidisphaeraceae bacterium]
MKLFLETANLDEIREALSLGVLDGVSTSPALATREKADFADRLREICQVVKGPVSVEVVGVHLEEMLAGAHRVLGVAENVIVRLPTTKEGVKACKHLSSGGAMVHMTLCYQPAAALMAAKAGAAMVSPFVTSGPAPSSVASIDADDDPEHDPDSPSLPPSEGQPTDHADDRRDRLIENVRMIFANYGMRTQIVAGGVRTAWQLARCAMAGADAACVPFSMIEQLLRQPLTGDDRGY